MKINNTEFGILIKIVSGYPAPKLYLLLKFWFWGDSQLTVEVYGSYLLISFIPLDYVEVAQPGGILSEEGLKQTK